MAVYFITGKLGSGKTLCAVGKIRDYLEQGRRVATNLDLNLENLVPNDSKLGVFRLPDKPRVDDMDLLGLGCEDEDEDEYGAIFLDELGTWFNTRSWNDKTRLPLINWFLHARKKHWDVYFLVQDVENVDKQLRSSLCEHLVICGRTDRLTIPVIGPIIKFSGFAKVLPKFHYASVYYGESKAGLRVDRWWYRGRDLYSSYLTSQIFTDDLKVLNGEVVDFRSSRTLLPSYYLNNVQLKENLTKELNTLNGIETDLGQGARVSVVPSLKMDKLTLMFIGVAVLALYGFVSKSSDVIAAPVAIEKTVINSELPKEASLMSSIDLLNNPHAKLPLSREKAAIVLKPEITDYFLKMIQGHEVTVGIWTNENDTIKATLYISHESGFPNMITLDDLRVLGWIASRRGDFLFLNKENEKMLTYKIGV